MQISPHSCPWLKKGIWYQFLLLLPFGRALLISSDFAGAYHIKRFSWKTISFWSQMKLKQCNIIILNDQKIMSKLQIGTKTCWFHWMHAFLLVTSKHNKFTIRYRGFTCGEMRFISEQKHAKYLSTPRWKATTILHENGSATWKLIQCLTEYLR